MVYAPPTHCIGDRQNLVKDSRHFSLKITRSDAISIQIDGERGKGAHCGYQD
jgi:hypothetical protein